MSDRNPMARHLLLVGLGLLVGTALVVGLRSCGSDDEQAAQRKARARQKFWKQKVTRILATVEQNEKADIEAAMAPVEKYFTRAQKGTRSFSKSVLSWEAKRHLLASKASGLLDKLDRLPSWMKVRWVSAQLERLADTLDRNGFRTFVQGRLEKHVFSRQGIEAAVLGAVQRYTRRLEATDRDVLASLMKESRNLPKDSRLAPKTEQALGLRYETVRQTIVSEMLKQSSVGVGREVLMATTQKLGGKLMLTLAAFGMKQAGAKLGLLTAGAASAWWSFGIGLAVAVFGNWAIDYFLGKAGHSPQDKIQKKMAAEVKRVRGCVIDGCVRKDGGKTVTVVGLRTWLEHYRALWVEARALALAKLVLSKP